MKPKTPACPPAKSEFQRPEWASSTPSTPVVAVESAAILRGLDAQVTANVPEKSFINTAFYKASKGPAHVQFIPAPQFVARDFRRHRLRFRVCRDAGRNAEGAPRTFRTAGRRIQG